MSRGLTDYAGLIYDLISGKSKTLFPNLLKLWYTLNLNSGTTLNPGELGTNAATIASSTTLYLHKSSSSTQALLLDKLTIAGAGLVSKRLEIYGTNSDATVLFNVSAVSDSGSWYTLTVSIIGGNDELTDGETVSVCWILPCF